MRGYIFDNKDLKQQQVLIVIKKQHMYNAQHPRVY